MLTNTSHKTPCIEAGSALPRDGVSKYKEGYLPNIVCKTVTPQFCLAPAQDYTP